MGKENAAAPRTSDRPDGPFDVEDLVPVDVGLAAVKRYLREMGVDAPDTFPEVEAVRALLSKSVGVLKATQMALDSAGIELRLEKLGFARHAVSVAADEAVAGAIEMRSRFSVLFSHLTTMQRKAERERSRDSIEARVERERSLLLRDHTGVPTKEAVLLLLERIEAAVDQSIEGDALLIGIRRIRDEFELQQDLTEPVDDVEALRDRLEALQYAEILASQPEAQSTASDE